MQTPDEQVKKLQEAADRGSPLARAMLSLIEAKKIDIFGHKDTLPEGETLTIYMGTKAPAVIGARQQRCSCGTLCWICPGALELMRTYEGRYQFRCSVCCTPERLREEVERKQ